LVEKDEIKPKKSIDTIGLYCPVPLFRTREAMDSSDLDVEDILEVLADDPAAESDLKSFAKRTGHEILKIEKDDDILRFLIKKKK
jgi:TusA-related sulfurtransferase